MVLTYEQFKADLEGNPEPEVEIVHLRSVTSSNDESGSEDEQNPGSGSEHGPPESIPELTLADVMRGASLWRQRKIEDRYEAARAEAERLDALSGKSEAGPVHPGKDTTALNGHAYYEQFVQEVCKVWDGSDPFPHCYIPPTPDFDDNREEEVRKRLGTKDDWISDPQKSLPDFTSLEEIEVLDRFTHNVAISSRIVVEPNPPGWLPYLPKISTFEFGTKETGIIRIHCFPNPNLDHRPRLRSLRGRFGFLVSYKPCVYRDAMDDKKELLSLCHTWEEELTEASIKELQRYLLCHIGLTSEPGLPIYEEDIESILTYPDTYFGIKYYESLKETILADTPMEPGETEVGDVPVEILGPPGLWMACSKKLLDGTLAWSEPELMLEQFLANLAISKRVVVEPWPFADTIPYWVRASTFDFVGVVRVRVHCFAMADTKPMASMESLYRALQKLDLHNLMCLRDRMKDEIHGSEFHIQKWGRNPLPDHLIEVIESLTEYAQERRESSDDSDDCHPPATERVYADLNQNQIRDRFFRNIEASGIPFVIEIRSLFASDQSEERKRNHSVFEYRVGDRRFRAIFVPSGGQRASKRELSELRDLFEKSPIEDLECLHDQIRDNSLTSEDNSDSKEDVSISDTASTSKCSYLWILGELSACCDRCRKCLRCQQYDKLIRRKRRLERQKAIKGRKRSDTSSSPAKAVKVVRFADTESQSVEDRSETESRSTTPIAGCGSCCLGFCQSDSDDTE
ncbi:MAG: hypothetical protein FJ333_07575 [Sphingomonadales bacterium]|nr:hypothetical protein [Sphingomonadales bacterium]